jgi:hypothetical protein
LKVKLRESDTQKHTQEAIGRERHTWRKQSDEESRGPLKRPAAEMALRSRTKSAMAVAGRGSEEEGGVKTPKGRLWMEKGESAGTGRKQEEEEEAMEAREEEGRRSYGSTVCSLFFLPSLVQLSLSVFFFFFFFVSSSLFFFVFSSSFLLCFFFFFFFFFFFEPLIEHVMLPVTCHMRPCTHAIHACMHAHP